MFKVMLVVLLAIVLVTHGTATKLAKRRKINGTDFDGSSDIETQKWGRARTLELSGAVSGSASVDGSGNVSIITTQTNIATLTGSMSIEASNSKVITINYPSGFTKDNSVVISAGIVTTGDGNESGYNYFGMYSSASDSLSNAFRRRVNMTNSGVNLWIENPKTSALSIDYKVVLMKIS